MDYLDPNANITAEEKESCKAILKHLPVVFTFAPMNLLHYRAKFPARRTRLVAVSYSQYAYADTRGSGSYQLAYVLHPATLWNDFGPIHLTVQVPKGIACKASVPLEPAGQVTDPAAPTDNTFVPTSGTFSVYTATLADSKDKSGELFAGIDKAAWDTMFPTQQPSTPGPKDKHRQER